MIYKLQLVAFITFIIFYFKLFEHGKWVKLLMDTPCVSAHNDVDVTEITGMYQYIDTVCTEFLCHSRYINKQ